MSKTPSITITIDDGMDVRSFKRTFMGDVTSPEFFEAVLTAHEGFTYVNDVEVCVKNKWQGDALVTFDTVNGMMKDSPF